MTSLVQGFTTNTWIGLNNQRHHRRFVWQDNSIFYYTNWNAGEPNGRSQYGRPGSVGINRVRVMVFNTTFSNISVSVRPSGVRVIMFNVNVQHISVISWTLVLLM